MNKRQRKKHHLEEFQELCFDVECEFKIERTDMLNKIVDLFIDFVDSVGLQMGGIFTLTGMEQTFLRHTGGTSSESDRQLVDEFLCGLKLDGLTVSNIRLGPLKDAWYDGAAVYQGRSAANNCGKFLEGVDRSGLVKVLHEAMPGVEQVGAIWKMSEEFEFVSEAKMKAYGV